MKESRPFLVHSHTSASNFRLRDAINKPESLIDYCHGVGLSGVCITDHETLSSHVKAFRHLEENKDRLGDFQVSYGNEIYLVDREDTLTKKEEYGKISFYHFILLAKNQNGYEGLRKLSSKAWSNSFFYKGMERVPTYKDDLEEIMEEYKGDIIATTACVGGEVPQSLIEYYREATEENRIKVYNLITWMKKVFGDDLYFELQPSKNEDQLIANKMLLSAGKSYDIKCIVSTDAHYLNKNQARAHEIYLQASQGEREVAAFYSTTYVMGKEELLEYFDSELLETLCINSNEIKNKIQPITFEQDVKIPRANIPEYELNELFESYYEDYEYIKKYRNSKYEVDKYYLHLIAEGMISKKQELNEVNLSRINTELNELYHITEKLKQPLSSYFVLSKEVVDIMWEVSLVGVSRGSASCFYLNYLLDIVQINPIKFNLPHWRFLSKERPELPDIDIDAEGSRRVDIIKITKEHYGEENVLNMGTFTTEGTRSTVLTSCRGLGIDTDISHNIANLIPSEKSGVWNLKRCFEGDSYPSSKNPSKDFILEVAKYEGLKETMLAIEGIISGRGQHASGVIIFPDGYIKQNAMMKTTSGLPVTQFDAIDSVYMGGLKLDYLSINALDRIRSSMELLLEDGKIIWQGTLRKTYDKYFHPDVLEMGAPEMYEMLYDGHVLNAFQFETSVGRQALTKIDPKSFDELCAGNSLMRLSTDGEQPLDKYVRFKKDINEWYGEMREFFLSDEEINILTSHLLDRYGICDTQEGLMEISMDPKISNFSLSQANNFRKSVAKQNQELIEKQKVIFYKQGLESGSSENFLDYVWYKCLSPQFGYAFSLPHIAGYTLILMIEMNICYRFGPVYWKTACLSVNSGLTGDNTSGGVSYGALSKAIGDMKEDVLPPDINLSNMGFTPLEKDGKILFGLKPISGLGVSSIEVIIENRPYTSIEDFMERIIDTGLIGNPKGVTLIKSGCFDSFNKDRRKLMIEYVRRITPKRDKLTMAQINTLIHFIDKEKYKKELDLYNFRQTCFGRNKIPMNKDLENYFISTLMNDVEYDFSNGVLEIDKKSFEKYYGKAVDPLRMFLAEPETIDEFNKVKMREFWKSYCMGTAESWEMQTILFYSNKHEIEYMPLSNYFNIVDFQDLSEDPVVIGYSTYRGRKFPKMKIDVVVGTVVDKNKGKRLVSVLTKKGVITVRYTKGQFAHYDKKVVRVNGKEKEVLDKSWFERGTNLVLIGFRRGEEFILRKTGTIFDHTTLKINGYDSEKISFQNEKAKE